MMTVEKETGWEGKDLFGAVFRNVKKDCLSWLSFPVTVIFSRDETTQMSTWTNRVAHGTSGPEKTRGGG